MEYCESSKSQLKPETNKYSHYVSYCKAYFENYILVKQLSKAVSDNIFLEEAVKDIDVSLPIFHQWL